MEKLDLLELTEFVNSNIAEFHRNKIKILEGLNLKKVLQKKNPYLFKTKNLIIASDLIKDIMDALLSSSEEKIFGNFLEDLAIFIVNKTCNGWKSPATGIDLEFINNAIHYLVSVKSGPNWGNSAQHREQEKNFQDAIRVLKQSKHIMNIQAVEGICYGKVKTSYIRGHMKVVGQNFWYLISEDENLYTDIIEPLGHKAKEHNEDFIAGKGKLINLFTEQFMQDFCTEGSINWKKLVEFNSGNLDLIKRNTFLPFIKNSN